jgi:hypothetical protein
MGDAEDHIETDDQWLDDFFGEEDFAWTLRHCKIQELTRQ